MAGTRSPTRLALLITIFLVLVVGGAIYVITKPSSDFMLIPDRPHPADAIVSVGGEDPRSTNNGPGIYYLDVFFHRATIFESWLTPLEKDVESIPAAAFLPATGSTRDLNRLGRLDIQGSKRLAALVALRALGRNVTVTGGGVRVDQVDPASPAHAAGLAPGMVVTGVDGKRVSSLTALRAFLKPLAPGTSVTLLVLDGTHRKTISTRLTRSSAAPHRALVGISGVDVAPNVKLPIPVHIDTANIVGPSAGLAFSLEIYDSLTGRRLTLGRHVAVTGTIDEDGRVGPVGGIKGKTVGARDAGFDLMLVPRAEAGTARRYAGSHLRVVGVRTFAEALTALRK